MKRPRSVCKAAARRRIHLRELAAAGLRARYGLRHVWCSKQDWERALTLAVEDVEPDPGIRKATTDGELRGGEVRVVERVSAREHEQHAHMRPRSARARLTACRVSKTVDGICVARTATPTLLVV
jgi:hypothetical protein